MGKGIRKNTSRLILFTGMLFLLLSETDSHASFREYELFHKGYEYYLSYQPEKAVEEFRIFLKEFPESSTKDAVMFWLAKSLTQLRSFEEAAKVFSDIKEEFPESSLTRYVEKELEITKKALSDGSKEKTPAGDIARESNATDQNTDGKKEQPVERPSEVLEYAGKPQVPAEGERTEELRSVFNKPEERETYEINSSFVLDKLDIKDVLWRTGNISEDVENERILYEEAIRSNIEADEIMHEELAEKYDFTPEQADYLNRYLAICQLLDRKLNEMPGEKVVESLVVKYEESDKYRKIVISTELQMQAKDGVPFEEIQESYPDLVKVIVSDFETVEEGIKEKIRYLQDSEVCVIWSEEGYMILKPVMKKLSCKPLGKVGSGPRNKVKGFIKEWLNELRTRDMASKLRGPSDIDARIKSE
jgi:tetratricopeptide (TPR) repeat protein